MRPPRSALAGSITYAFLGLLWLGLSRPTYGPGLATWVLGLALAGLFLAGWANQVTLARAYLAAPAFVYSTTGGNTSLGYLAVTVAVAGLSDLLDGFVARRVDDQTKVGGALDPVVDGLFFGAVATGLAVAGAYPSWLAGLVVVRYLLPAAIGAALLISGRDPHIQHTPFGQLATTVIAVMLGGVALLRGLGLDSGAMIVAGEVIIPLATLAAFVNLFRANRTSIMRSEGEANG
ncbi:MAG TPA: CDP-alcohol phosphatidyltransferase family protein [Candidatus Acidoferrales bacterium]|nr:CDP-alcohol phosphatidyltransferase family protein [Candidatus Acidoferrales bacterium]